MKKYNLLSLVLPIFILISSCTTLQKERNVSSSAAETVWISTDKNTKDSLIRSNPQHFWQWMKENPSSGLEEFMKFQGEITADPHFFNFGDIHNEANETGLSLVDIDDSGKGPYILDFVRFNLFVKAYTKENYLNEMYNSYLTGLKQEKRTTPKVIQKALAHNRQDLQQFHQDWVENNLNDDLSLRKKKNDLTDLNDSTNEQKNIGFKIKNILISEKKVSKVYDIGFTIHDSGSSHDLNRYWFSVILNGQNDIIECKELSRPATDFFTPQLAHKERIENVLKYYSDFEINDSYVIEIAANNSYWCRPRHFQFYDRSEITGLNTVKLKELALYFSYWLGYKQSVQPNIDDYIALLQRRPYTITHIEKLLKDYLKEVKRLKQN